MEAQEAQWRELTPCIRASVVNNNVFITRGTECRARRVSLPWSRMDEPVNARPRSPLSRNIAPRGTLEGETGQSDFFSATQRWPYDTL